MKILILGYSDLAQRKIIPAIKKLKKIKFDIASKSKKENKMVGHEKWYRNYDLALSETDANIVYISLVNSLHFKYALKSLKFNKHVIIDKPITLNISQTKKLIQISKQKKLMISEALVFSYHIQFKLIKKIIEREKTHLTHIVMKFCIPKPKKNNFKLSNKMGGGCFNDMSPYAAGVVRLFLKDKIQIKNIEMDNKNKLNTGFCLIAKSKKINFIGVFSHNSEYINSINFIAKNYLINASRFSAPPTNLNLFVHYKRMNNKKKYMIKKDDMFKTYLKEYLTKLRNKDYFFYNGRILKDARFIHNLKKFS